MVSDAIAIKAASVWCWRFEKRCREEDPEHGACCICTGPDDCQNARCDRHFDLEDARAALEAVAPLIAAEAYRKGQERMRERALDAAREWSTAAWEEICALPIEEPGDA